MREFNKLWAGQSVSLLGTALTLFALPTLAVLVLRATPVQVGALSALETVPFPVLGLIVGVLADRFSRKRIMVVADLVRFVALATIPVCALLHVLQMPVLYAVALVNGTASVFFGISYQSYLPVVVSNDRLTDANTKLEFSNSGAQIAGNALGGVLVQWLGAPVAIAVNAASYLVSVASLALIGVQEQPHAGPQLSVRQGFHEMREGLHIVLHSSDLRWIACATATINFGGSIIGAVALIYAYRVLHLQPALLGLVWGFAEIGFVGALLAGRMRARFGLRATLIAMLAINSLAAGAMLLAQLGWPYVALFACAAISAVAVPIYNVNQISYRQALVNVRVQGRMNATMRTFVWGTLPLGALTGGWLGAFLGVPAAIAVGALFSGCSALWLLPLRERDAFDRTHAVKA